MSASKETRTPGPGTRPVASLPAWRSPWVWGMAGLVLFAMGMNVVMIWMGMATHPGLVVNDFYERGKNYFHAEAVRQDATDRLGWALELQIPGTAVLNAVQTYRLQVRDAQGYPVSAAAVEFAAFRPSNAGRDFSLPMREEGGGVYVAEVEFALPGNWDLIVTARRGEDRQDTALRLFVQD